MLILLELGKKMKGLKVWLSVLLQGLFYCATANSDSTVSPMNLCLGFNADYSGTEITRMPSDSVDVCRGECEYDDNCSFYSYYPGTSICVLRNGEAYQNLLARPEILGGHKTCFNCAAPDSKLTGKPLGKVSAFTAGHCQHKCVSTSGCKGFSWHVETKDCDLFGEYTTPQKETGWVSAPSVCGSPVDNVEAPQCALRKVKFRGEPIRSEDTQNALICQDICKNDSDCEAFVFDVVKKLCHLHLAKAEESKVKYDGFISGPKACLMHGKCSHSRKEWNWLFFKHFGSDFTTPEECQLRCQSYPECTHWTHRTDTGACALRHFKEDMVEPKDHMVNDSNPNKSVGPKYCSESCNLLKYQSPSGYTASIIKKLNLTADQCRDVALKSDHTKIFTSWANGECYAKENNTIMYLIKHNGEAVFTGFSLGCPNCFQEGKAIVVDNNLILTQLAQSVVICQYMCKAFEQCTFFSYYVPLRRCRLLSGNPEYEDSENTISGPSNCKQLTDCFQEDKKYTGDFDRAGEWFIFNVKSAGDCQKFCAKKPGCRSFTYEKKSTRCYLRHAGSENKVVVQSGWTSGPKKCYEHIHGNRCIEKFDYSGSDIAGASIEKTELDCQRRCYGDPKCSVFTYNNRDKKCWKKTIQGLKRRYSLSYANSGGRLGCAICFRVGISYTGKTVQTLDLNDMNLCQRNCEFKSDCKFFTTVKGKCYLKSSRGNEVAERGAVSGPRSCSIGPGDVFNASEENGLILL